MKPIIIPAITAALHLLLFVAFPGAGAQHRSPAAEAMDWQSLGGPDRSFTVEDAGLFRPGESYALKVAWKRSLGSGYSGISVKDGLAVTMFSDETSDYVVGLDADDGSERWRHRIGPAYLGHYGSQSGPVSTPLITDRQVIALSPRGSLFALDAETGRQLWTVDLVQDHHGRVPFWGFTTSPLTYKNMLIVQTGGTAENAISAFDSRSGNLVWAACSDTVDYQSPCIFKLDDRDHLVFHGNRYLFGLDPETGEVLWEFAHGGQNSASSTSGHPVEVSEGRYFVKNRGNGGVLLNVRQENGTYSASEVWRTRHIRGTYIYPVYHGGYLYGYSGPILTCVDAKTGEMAWRSREPGDGLPAVIDGYLAIITKGGKLAIAPASSDGYSETASLKLFDDIVWSPLSFANGRLYARSMSEIACVEIVSADQAAGPVGPVAGIVPKSRFADFVRRVEEARDKVPLVEQFLSEQKAFPVIEGDGLVHFVYRGEASDVTMTGDLVGRRFDQPMHRVDGTDLFYYSSHIEPDARITYRYTVDLQKAMPDPLNPRDIRSRFFGRASWFAMPEWESPDYLHERQDGIHGRMDTLRFRSASGDVNRVLNVYLPAGYDRDESDRYPVVYAHSVPNARRLGKLDISLDNLIGTRVRPVVVVFLPSLIGGGYLEYVGSRRDDYSRIFVEEIVPFVDSVYRTIPNRSHRANYGTIYGAFMAFYATFTHPDVFGNVAIQTIAWDQTAEAEDAHLVVSASNQLPMRIYLDWGRYDMRSPMEGNDLGKDSRSFAELLEARGYAYTGGMVNDGAGWASWKNRTDKVFETLFPMSD